MPSLHQVEKSSPLPSGLGQVFYKVSTVLEHNRQDLNEADPINGNHGDHMVEIFSVASTTASALMTGSRPASMSEILFTVGHRLEALPENESAHVYGQGLIHFAHEFQSREIELPDLEVYVRQVLADSPDYAPSPSANKGKDVLKALLGGLVGWKKAENGRAPAPGWLDMGALFEFGIIYLQAKEAGGSKAEVIARAAAISSPLNEVPHRLQSGRIALLALLQALDADARVP